MRTQEEAEAWAREHEAVLRVNFAVGDAALQVGGFVAYIKGGTALRDALPELVAELERQIGERLTPADAGLEDVTRPR